MAARLRRVARTVSFGFDGQQYEIDLFKANAHAFAKEVKPYLEVARRVSASLRLALREPQDAGPNWRQSELGQRRTAYLGHPTVCTAITTRRGSRSSTWPTWRGQSTVTRADRTEVFEALMTAKVHPEPISVFSSIWTTKNPNALALGSSVVSVVLTLPVWWS